MSAAHHLDVVGEAGEDEAGDDEDHDQEAELRHALAQREHDGLQTPGVSGDNIIKHGNPRIYPACPFTSASNFTSTYHGLTPV